MTTKPKTDEGRYRYATTTTFWYVDVTLEKQQRTKNEKEGNDHLCDLTFDFVKTNNDHNDHK
jgi:hypothetical protein